MEFTVNFHGHENIRSLHRNTLEITCDKHLTPSGDCIVIGAQCGCLRLPDLLKTAQRRSDSNVRIVIRVGDDTFTVNAHGSPDHPSAYYCIDDDDPIKPYKGVRGKAKVRIIDDVKIIHPMTVRIVTKYTGGTDNKIAKKILDGVNDGGSVLLELHPSYYSTWDHSTA